uniref:Bro-N domain-containing protein n=1 Tax=viral metagenome TaxID=1070528 RepID=A0A6C0EC62_9ZZZZ
MNYLTNEEFNIHIYNDAFCLDDIITQCDLSKNHSEYIKKIKYKILHNKQYYLTKINTIDLLERAKASKSKLLLPLIKEYKSDEIIVSANENQVAINNNSNIINFVDNGSNTIIYNNKQIKYFYFNDNVYFKGKDVALMLDYSDTVDAINTHVEELDQFAIKSFINICEGFYPSPSSLNSPDNYLIYSLGDPPNFPNDFVLPDNIKKEDPKTIFINESGLYSIIFGSKKQEAKIFKRWVTSEVLPSIRKSGSYHMINNYSNIDKYKNKDCVYILYIKDNLYKYGRTHDIQERLSSHKRNLDYIKIERIYLLSNINQTIYLENNIKELTKKYKINTIYNTYTEIFEINNFVKLNKLLDEIDELSKDESLNNLNLDNIIDIEICKNERDKIDYKKYLEKLKFDKYIRDIQHIEKIKELELKEHEFIIKELELKLKIEELKNNNKSTPNNIINYASLQSSVINNITSSSNELFNNVSSSSNEQFNSVSLRSYENNKIDSNEISITSIKKCIDCNNNVSKKALRCNLCQQKLRIKTNLQSDTNRPTLDQLNKDLKELKSYVAVGKKYNVSDNAIRKWINSYKKILN